MIRMNQIKLSVDHTPQALEQKIRKLLKCGNKPFTFEIMKQSLDARHKDDKKFVYTVDVEIQGEKNIIQKVHNNNIMLIDKKPYVFPQGGKEPLEAPPVIVGSGPAGLFCAWYLAYAGFRPIVLERGDQADIRQQNVEAFWQNGVLDPESNVQFGEGGAGTFSDGKLNTLVKDPFGRGREVLKRFVEAGAPAEILFQQKPHLGTDLLVGIVQKMRHEIEEMGGKFHFRSKVTDLVFEQGALKAVEINGTQTMDASVCVLAIGHSARDTFAMLHKKGLYMEPKSFAVGVRVEHPQKLINAALYGEEENEKLGAASYKLTHTCKDGRGVYSFCMCPGGYVVNASSEPEMLAVNGMSYQARDSHNANSAVVVTVNPEDFPEDGVLGGIAFQRVLEHAAWEAGKGKIPVQTFGDYCTNQPSKEIEKLLPCMKGAYQPTNVRGIFPKEIGDCIEEGMHAYSRKIPGFDRADALLSGVESRTSSPVRIVRDKELQSNRQGIYPCGEGAGYAGGITSAAMDGIKIAETISKKFKNF